MKGMSVKSCDEVEEKHRADSGDTVMVVDSGEQTDSQRVRAEQAVYDLKPIVPLLHEPKTDEKGEFLLNKKQRKGGIGVGGYESVGEIVNPDYARTHSDRVVQPHQQRPNVGPYGGEAVRGNSWRQQEQQQQQAAGGAVTQSASGSGSGGGSDEAQHARQGAIRYIGGSERYTGAACQLACARSRPSVDWQWRLECGQ